MSRSSCVRGARIGPLRAMTVAQVSMLAQPIMFAAAPQEAQAREPEAKQLMPEQTMNSRDPQPVQAGFLAGLPVLEEGDTVFGFAVVPTFALGQGARLGVDEMIDRNCAAMKSA